MPTLYKVTFQPSDSLLGSSISLILSSEAGLSDTALYNKAVSIFDFIADAFSNPNASTRPNVASPGYPLLQNLRISIVGQRNQTLAIAGPITGACRPIVWTPPSGSQSYNNGVNLRMRSAGGVPEKVSATSLWLPSVPDAVVSNDVYDGSAVVGEGLTHRQLISRMVAQLTAGGADVWGHLGRNPAVPIRQLTLANVVGGNWTFTTVSAAGWAVGDILQISTANARGWNGLYRIIDITGSVVTVANGPRSDQPGFTSAQGTLFRRGNGELQQVFYRYTAMIGEPKFAVRKPSRPFSPVSFRRRRTRIKTSR